MTTTATDQPLDATAKAACDEILKLKRKAKDVVDEDFHALAEAASRDGGGTDSLRLTEQTSLAELVDGAAWLASDLVDVLLKVAAGHRPHVAVRSDLVRRIQEAEVRLELLRQLNR